MLFNQKPYHNHSFLKLLLPSNKNIHRPSAPQLPIPLAKDHSYKSVSVVKVGWTARRSQWGPNGGLVISRM